MSRYNFRVKEKLLDRYEIIEHIGKGSYGDVFKCLDNRPSILKAREIGERILDKMKEFVEVFVHGMVG